MNLSFKPTPKIVLDLKKKGVTSGASRNTLFFAKKFPLEIRHKKLVSRTLWRAGRSKAGHRILRTRRKRTLKLSTYSINYSFRDRRLSFVASTTFVPALNKLLSLVFLSSGSVCYTVTTTEHRLFHLVRLQSCFWRKNPVVNYLSTYNKTIKISQGWYILNQLPKNQPISLLEVVPERGAQYARATGSKAVMIKMDSRVSTSLVKLPSGVKKVFSTYSIASLGSVALPDMRRRSIANAGFNKRLGRRSMVRGVAKNPVDHPHGGRTKTLVSPRTPWGLPTKLK